jgi:ketosteroid isomerase-like protein
VSFDEEYIAAWNSGDEERFVGQFAPDGCYTDATMALSYDGESEIRRMFRSTMEYYENPRFVYVSGFSDDRHYAVEWTSITVVNGTEYTTRVLSIGDLDDQGRITENRDYWNPQRVPNEGDMSAEAAAFEQRSAQGS